MQLSDSAIRIEPGPLPDGLPQYMTDGQCTAERMEADQDDARRAFAQVTGWQRQGQTVVLEGSDDAEIPRRAITDPFETSKKKGAAEAAPKAAP